MDVRLFKSSLHCHISGFARSLLAAIGSVIAGAALAVGGDPIDFNRDVRPILSNNCFACHGFDEQTREANLRLDTREGATSTENGVAAIVPGDPGQSELIARVSDTDSDTVMPPAESHKKPLTPDNVSVLRRWIEQGAKWGKHWAFESPVAVDVSHDMHPIDYFVGRRLKDTALSFAPRAPVHTLARRLSFDLTGLPPSADDVAGLGESPSDEKWNDWISALLESPHYGERMAMWWLDGARYSDTDGFQADATRTNWPWRDWVVTSFNSNKPFDQFTIEQFAGDLLPDSTDDQKLATCFHRNHMHNGEGGRDPAESRVDYVLDRTNTMGTLWLGLTLGCTQCHDHKFDPISQRDYYGLTAYFDNIDEDGSAGGNAKPFLTYRSPLAQHSIDEARTLVAEIDEAMIEIKSAAESEFAATLDQMITSAKSFRDWWPARPLELKLTEGTPLEIEDGAIVRAGDGKRNQDDYQITILPTDIPRITGLRLEVFADETHADQKYSYADGGEFNLTNIKLQVRSRRTTEVRDIDLAKASASQAGKGEFAKQGGVSGTLDDDPRTGWTTRGMPLESTPTAVFELSQPLKLASDEVLDVVLMHRSLSPRELIGRFRLSVTDQRGSAVRSLEKMPMQRLAEAMVGDAETGSNPIDKELRGLLFDQFLEDYPPWQASAKRNRMAKDQLAQAERAAGDLQVTVLAERSDPRETHILVRGVWDQHGEKVSRGVLPAVMDTDTADVPTRLELANWIVSRANPLTARVIVNHVWQLFFGAGLVRTPNDFGLQGESPTHPELLDWLAIDFMDNGWDIKHLVRRIVSSRTYQQDSAIVDAIYQRDPENRLLARGARYRLPSWMIRDAYLCYSGLINPAIGGPPVFPYQPPGVWQDQFMGRFTYVPSIGPAQYRRTLYAFWRRSSTPTFLFDSAMRRSCEVIPRRTNTPLHALTLMNDLTALEAARTLAQVPTDMEPTSFLFRQVLCRLPNAAETEILQRELDNARDYYAQHPGEANELTTVGQLPPLAADTTIEVAARMVVANMIMNLDEAITHE